MSGAHASSDVHVVVVAYGADEHLAAALSGLEGKFDVTVVDNASSHTCAEICRAAGADYVDAGANLGFAAGVNIGLDRAPQGSHVLLLNPDARISPDAVAALARRLDAAPGELAAVAPRLVDPTTGEHQRVAWPFPTPGRQWLVAAGLGRVVRSTGFLVGAVLLLNHRALAEVGPFDEGFFLYAEETDWQRRATDLGWHVEVVADVVAEHVGGASSSSDDGGERQQVLFHAGTETYLRKRHGSSGWAAFRAAHLAGDAVRWLSGGARREPARRRLRLYARGPLSRRSDLLGPLPPDRP